MLTYDTRRDGVPEKSWQWVWKNGKIEKLRGEENRNEGGRLIATSVARFCARVHISSLSRRSSLSLSLSQDLLYLASPLHVAGMLKYYPCRQKRATLVMLIFCSWK